MREIEV